MKRERNITVCARCDITASGLANQARHIGPIYLKREIYILKREIYMRGTRRQYLKRDVRA